MFSQQIWSNYALMDLSCLPHHFSSNSSYIIFLQTALEHVQGTEADKNGAVCLFRRKWHKQEESGQSLCSPPPFLCYTTFFFFLLARGLFSRLHSRQQHLFLTSTCTLQCNTMSLALVVILVAFLTGASGSPSVTMKPEIHLGSNPSSGVPDTAGEAHFFEEVRLFFQCKKKNTVK